MKKIIILLAAIAMTTLTAQANETMDTVSSAVEKAVDALSPVDTTDAQKAVEASNEEKAAALKEKAEKASENK